MEGPRAEDQAERGRGSEKERAVRERVDREMRTRLIWGWACCRRESCERKADPTPPVP